MRNTWRNVFLQSMKNNTLSVKKLTKNLILRTQRELYPVSEIIILIRWVTPPQNVENLQLSFSSVLWNSSIVLQLYIVFTLSVVVLHWLYIYLSFYVLYNIHLLLFLQVACSAKWMWSDPSPSMLNSTQSVHKFFMCVLFETRSKSSLCPC